MSQPQQSPQETLGYGEDTGRSSDDGSRELQPGDRVGKYFVLDVLGRGAMGVVHRAYDPQLERAVALKIVRAGAHVDDTARARLVAEARALARVSHPNVVTVYDVGEHERRIYVAMELVDGIDLARWLKERPRTRAEIVAVFVAAGQGLVAVHAAGLVHRDVKPANVLCGHDGRVRIGDFGIARAQEPRSIPSIPTDADEPIDSGLVAVDQSLTAAGLVVGTPAFMAPEQHYGLDVGPPADQYAFCVALYESIAGERLFPVDARRLPLVKIDPPTQSPSSTVPRWLWAVIVRGLQVDPAHRFPSMAALVDALRADPARRRRRGLVAIGAGLLVAGALGLAAARPRPCTGAEEHLVGVWDDGTRTAIAAAFEANTRPYAASTWTAIRPRLDGWAQSWIAMHRAACEATRVSGEQSEALLDRRIACLEGRRRGLSAVVHVLTRGDDDTVDHAVELVAALPGVDRCADLEALQSDVPPPDDPTIRAQVDAARETLARGQALIRAGRYGEARSIASESVSSARAIGHDPLLVEALALAGEAHEALADLPEARAALEEALWSGLAIGHDEVAAESATILVWIAGERDREFERAQQWGELGRAVLRRAGDPVPIATKLFNALGAAHANAARYDEALGYYDEVLARIGDDASLAFRAASTRVNIANVWLMRGQPQRALPIYEQALDELEAQLGPDHPKIAHLRGSIALVLGDLGQHARAIELFDRAIAAMEASLGDTPELANLLINEANALGRLGRDDEVLPSLERALAILEKHPDPTALSSVHNNLGEIYYNREVYDASRMHYERALAIIEQRFGKDHPDTAFPLVGLAYLLGAQGRHDEAIEMFERTVRVTSASLGSDNRLAAVALGGIAQVQREQKRYDDALATLDREAAVLDKLPFTRTDDRMVLATVRTEVLLDRGDPSAAIPELERWVARAREDNVEPGRVAQSELVLATALARVGRRAEALTVIDRAVAELERSPEEAEQVPLARKLRAELASP